MSRTSKCLWASMVVIGVALGTQAEAQDRAGVVTTLEGHVTVSRASLPEPARLKFRDDIYARDSIAAGQNSVARILLGGRAVVTVREHSTVTITETPGVATVDVTAGRVAVAVAREKMRAGDRIDVRTPNAVAGIRGTVVVAEVFGMKHSVITVLKGTVDVTRLQQGRPVGSAAVLNALERVSVLDDTSVPVPESVPPAAAGELGQAFRLAPPRPTPSAVTEAVNAGELARAAKDVAALPRQAIQEPRGLAKRVDDEHEEVVNEAARRSAAEPAYEKVDKGKIDKEKVGKVEHGLKGGVPVSAPEVPAAVKSSGRASESMTSIGKATKSGDKTGLKARDR